MTTSGIIQRAVFSTVTGSYQTLTQNTSAGFRVGEPCASTTVVCNGIDSIMQPKEMAMIEQRTDEFTQAKGKIAGDIKTVIADGEDLLKAAANVSGASLAATRDEFTEKLGSARARLVDAAQPAIDKAKSTAAAANGYVRGNPWTVIGVALAVGALVGLLIRKR
jgi:ElaB/YqjD/DUF883 family membrane-anchored ribosome-binding protein